MPLPKVEAPLATATKASQVQGGTAVVAESSRSGALLGLGLFVLVAALVAVLVFRDDDSPKSAAQTEEGAEPAPLSEAVPDDQPVGIDINEKAPSAEELREAALSQLEEKLNAASLWSTVSVSSSSDSVISVVTGTCEDPDMRPVLAEAAGALRGVGFTALECVAKHGELLFELPL